MLNSIAPPQLVGLEIVSTYLGGGIPSMASDQVKGSEEMAEATAGVEIKGKGVT